MLSAACRTGILHMGARAGSVTKRTIQTACAPSKQSVHSRTLPISSATAHLAVRQQRRGRVVQLDKDQPRSDSDSLTEFPTQFGLVDEGSNAIHVADRLNVASLAIVLKCGKRTTTRGVAGASYHVRQDIVDLKHTVLSAPRSQLIPHGELGAVRCRSRGCTHSCRFQSGKEAEDVERAVLSKSGRVVSRPEMTR